MRHAKQLHGRHLWLASSALFTGAVFLLSSCGGGGAGSSLPSASSSSPSAGSTTSLSIQQLIKSTDSSACSFVVSSVSELTTALQSAQNNDRDDVICLQAGTYELTETLSFVPATTDRDNAIAIIKHPRATGQVVITRAQNAGNIRLMLIDYGTTTGDANGRVLVQGIIFRNGIHPTNEQSPYFGNGAGLYIRVNDAKVYVVSNRFENNRNAEGDTTRRRGGGLYVLVNGAGEVNVLNNLFVGNSTTQFGGGAYVELGTNARANMTNNTFVDNKATGAREGTTTYNPNGGGANIGSRSNATGIVVNAYNNLFWNNLAQNQLQGATDQVQRGNDLYIFRATNASLTVNLYNNLFRQTNTNVQNPFRPTNDTNPYNLEISSATGVTYNQGNNVLNDNNPFVPTSQCQYAVGPNSPALNRGKTDAPMVNLLHADVMNNPRIVGTAVDIGAYEYYDANVHSALIVDARNVRVKVERLNDSRDGIIDVATYCGPNDLNCYYACRTSANRVIRLTAENVPQGQRAVFSDTCRCASDSPENVCFITLSQNTYCMVSLAPVAQPPRQFTLSVRVEGEGDGRVTSNPQGIDCTRQGGTCQYRFDENTDVNLTATPDEKSVFAGWSGACEPCGKNTTCTIKMNSDEECVAKFDLKTYTITTMVNPENAGTVICEPNPVKHGQRSVCTITPAQGYEIERVAGTCGGTLEGNRYTTEPVTKECSVEVYFRMVQQPQPPQQPPADNWIERVAEFIASIIERLIEIVFRRG